jgi:uncharacterized protein
MTTANKMLDGLAKMPGLRVVEPHEAAILGGESVRFDGWSNAITGIGTERDKTSYNNFVADRTLQDSEASAIYHGSDLAGRIVDIVPDEMYREGFSVDLGDSKLNTELDDQVEALGLVDKLADANRWGRLYGGGGLLLGADDGRSASQPLMPERAKHLGYVYVLDRRYLWPLTYYRESGHQKLGQPETYMVTSPTYQTDTPVAVVHESRLVLFGGATTGIREREANSGWDFSILQRATKVLSDFDLGWGAASILLADGNQAVMNISGLADALAQPGGAETFLRERLRLIDMGRSVCRAIVLDAGDPEAKQPAEQFTRQSFPMTGIPDVLEKLMVRLSVTADVPCTRLFGISPAGLNATGESDVRGWYDRIRSNQTRKQTPKIRRIIRVMVQTKAVQKSPNAIAIKFPSLWSESPQQAAQTRQAILTGDKIACDAGILLPEEVARHRFAPGGGGFEKEVALTLEGAKAREAALAGELAGLIPDADASDVPSAEIAPTDVAATLTVNEVRATQGFAQLKLQDGSDDPDGFMSVASFKAKSAPAPGGFGGRGGPPSAKEEADEAEATDPSTAEAIDDGDPDDDKPTGGGGNSRIPKALTRTDWDEDQPRDEQGRFGEGGGGASGGGGPSATTSRGLAKQLRQTAKRADAGAKVTSKVVDEHEQGQALRNYVGTSAPVNQYMRDRADGSADRDQAFEQEIQGVREVMDAVRQSGGAVDGVVIRGERVGTGAAFADRWASLKNDDVIPSASFISTTTDQQEASEFGGSGRHAVLEITQTGGVALGGLGPFGGSSKEVLLEPGYLRVTGRSYDEKADRLYIKAEYTRDDSGALSGKN